MVVRKVKSTSILTIRLLLFVIVFVFFMYFGYFNDYSVDLFLLYFLFVLIVGIYYVFYYGTQVTPQTAFYNWLILLFFFPKKELPEDATALLNIGLGFEGEKISIYMIFNLFVICSIWVQIFRNRQSIVFRYKNEKKLVILYQCMMCMFFIGIFHFFYIWNNIDIVREVRYDAMSTRLLPILEGCTILVASIQFIIKKEELDKIFRIGFTASVLIGVEFLLMMFQFLPSSVYYYSINYRGAFRSAWQSGDLFITLLLMFGTSAAFYLSSFSPYKFNRIIYYISVVFFGITILFTYNRGSFISFCGLVLFYVYFMNSKSFLRLGVIMTLLFTALLIFSTVKGNNISSTLDENLNIGAQRDSYLDSKSTTDRIAIFLRSMDVFLYSPVIGIGPAQYVLANSSSIIPQNFSEFSDDKMVSNIYRNWVSNDSHNLFAKDMAEFGIVALLFWVVLVMQCCYFQFKQILSMKSLNKYTNWQYVAKISAFSCVIAFLWYYTFQSTAPMYALMCLLIRITFISSSTHNAVSQIITTDMNRNCNKAEVF